MPSTLSLDDVEPVAPIPAPRWQRYASASVLALCVLLACLWATFTLWRDAQLRHSQGVEARFEYRTERIRGELLHRLEGYEGTMRSVAGLIGARPGFDRGAWRRYFDKAQPPSDTPGRLFLAYAPRIRAADVTLHEQTARADGLVEYRVRSRDAASSSDRYPLAFMRRLGEQGPVEKLGVVPGTDMADDPVAADAMARAAREGRTILAGPLAWSKSRAEEDQVWALVVPVFEGAQVPASADERAAAVSGHLIEAFHVMDTVGSTLGPDAALIGLKVHDGDLALFTCPEMRRELIQGFQPSLRRASTVQFGNRTWTLEFVALPRYLAGTESEQPYLVLVAGALVSLLLAGLVGTLAGQRAHALGEVQARTAELLAALARSESSQARMRAVVDHALDSIITIDDQGIVQTFNPAAERTFGYGADEVVGHNLKMLMPAHDRERHDGYMHNFLTTGQAKIIGIGREVIGRRKDGSTFPMELGVSDMRIGDRRFFCGIVRDITQRRQSEQALRQERETLEVRVHERTEVLSQTNVALQQEIHERRRIEGELVAAREQALQAAEAKAGFLANMSHEIRTPMNAVIGMTALLEETPLTAEQRGYLETIRTGGDALLAVIDDILDFSKIESGMLELERRPFEVGACIEEAFDMLAPRAAEKGIDLLYVIDEDVPRWIVGDATRLRQVFINLLSNAVKFTHQGEVCMTASLASHEGTRVRLHFAVRDTGIGIPGDKRAHLFRAFSQADSSTTRKYGGTGLGLTICQRLTQLMGGDIAVESEEGRGSTFSFSISADRADSATLPSRYVNEPQPQLTGRRVLIVDDNPTNLHILETLCRRWGTEVATASGGAEALTLLDHDRLFDVAVLDLHMPGMDGVQLARQIRWLCPGNAPALVLLSSSVQRRSGVDQAELFAARLAKPVKHSQLFNALTQVLDPAQAARGGGATRRLDPTLAQRVPLKILVAEDSVINQKLAVGILAKLGYAGDVAGNGREAVELVRLNRYDLVLMDLQMPELDGLEATRRIVAELPAQSRPRIVAMTANALAGDRERCIDAGMDDYIAKPILPVDVQAVIERLCSGTQAAPAPFDPEQAPLIDLRVFDELRELDGPSSSSLLASLLQDYLRETPGIIGDIKHLSNRREAAPLAARAHKLGGVSASLGARGVADVCRRIEQQVAAGDLTSLPSLVDQLEMRFARTRAEFQRLA